MNKAAQRCPPKDWIRLGHWTQLRPTLLWAHRGDLPDWMIERQLDGARDSLDIWFLEKGSLVLKYANEQECYKAPCWVIPKHFPLRQKLSAGSKQLAIRFTLNWADDSPLFVLDRTITFPRGRYRSFERASEDLADFVKRRTAGTQVFVEERTASLSGMTAFFSQFWTWIGAYISMLEQMKVSLKPRSKLDSRVVVAIAHLRRLPLAEPLRVKDLAADCSLSVAQFNRLFRQQIGLSAARIRNRQRMSAACQGLLYSTATVKELAYSLGFCSPGHFAFWFRKHTGSGPRDFRMKH